MKQKLIYIIGIILLVSFISIGYNYFKPKQDIIKNEWVQPNEPKVVKSIQKVKVKAPKEILVYKKDEIIKKLELPDTFKNNTSIGIIASADVPPSKEGYVAIGTIESKDGVGVGKILIKEKNRSLIGLPSNFSIGSRYGTIQDGSQEGQIWLRYQPIRVGDVYLGIYGESDLGRKFGAKAMIELEYKIKTD